MPGGNQQAQPTVKLNSAGWDISRGTLAKIEAQMRCVTDYEVSKLAEGVGLDAPELLRRALTKGRKRPLF